MASDLSPEQKDHLEGILRDAALSLGRPGLVSREVAFTTGKQGGLAELAEALATAPRLLLVAPPGGGKTTLLHAILYDYAFYARYYQDADLSACTLCEERRLPIYIDLKQTDALDVLNKPPFVPAEDPTRREELLLLIDHPEVGVPDLADALKRPSFPQCRLVVAARDQDAPQIRSWLSPTVEARLLPLGEEATFHLLLAQGEDASAQRVVQLLTTHRLWTLAQTPALLHRLGQLAASGTLWGASRREIMEQLCYHILGPPPSPAWATLVELARRAQAKTPPQRAEAVSLFGDEELLEQLVSQGLLHWEGERLRFAQSPVQALFLAYALEEHLSSGADLGTLLKGHEEEVLLFLYDLSSHRQVLLRELLASPQEERQFLLAARCLTDTPPTRREGSAEVPLGSSATLRGLPPGIIDPNIYLGLGQAFRRLGKLEEARLTLEEGLRLSPDRPDLRWELAQVQDARGQGQLALNHYQRLRATMPAQLSWPLAEAQALAQAGHHPEALALTQETAGRLAQELSQAHQLLSRLWEQSGQMELALEAAEAAAQVSPGAFSFILWGRLLQQQGQTTEARSRLEQAVLLDLRSVEARLALAQFLESQGELSSAIAHLKEAVTLAPASAEAHLSLGRAYRAAGAYLQARLHLGQALALSARLSHSLVPTPGYPGPSLQAEVHAELALLEENQRNLKQALYHIRLALDLAPDGADFRFRLGWILAELGQENEAEAALRQALAAQPGNAAWHDRLGHLLLGGKRVEEARHEFATAMDLEPDNSLYHFNLGVTLGLLGETHQALDALQRATKPSGPRSTSVVDAVVAADAHRERGRILEGWGRPAQALAEYEQAAALLPHHTDYRLSQALAYGRLGQHQLMLDTLEQTARMNPDDPLAHFLLGQAYLTLGRYPEAATCLERACHLDPQAGDYLKAWGGLLRRLGKTPDALAALQQAVDLIPQDAEAYYQLGGAWEDAGELEAALVAYRAAARHQVNNPTYWTAVGQLLRRLDQGPEAIMALRTAISLNPESSPAHAELGQALAEVGRLTEGYQSLLRAATTGQDAEYWAQAARLARQLGKNRQALEHLEEALKLSPQHADLWAEQGQLLALQERWEEALSAWAQARELAPHQLEYALHLGQLLLHQDQAQEASRMLTPLVNQHPQWIPGRLALAQALIGVGDHSGAIEQCQRVISQETVGEAYGLMAEALVAAGRWEEAIAPLEKATALEPEEHRWGELLGRVHLQRRRPDLAGAVLSRVLAAGAPPRVEGFWGQALLAQGRYHEAASALRKALSQGHLSAEEIVAFLQDLGDTQRALGQPQEAWESYEAALDLAQTPSERIALRQRRAQHLLEMGQAQDAIAELEAALPGGSQGPELHLLLAQACRQAGEWEAAMAHARRAAQAQPQAIGPQRELGIILRHRGELGPAIKTLEATLAADPRDAIAWAELGQAYTEAGAPDRARPALERAVKEAPQEPRFRLLLGEWFLRQSRPSEALRQLEEARRLSPPEPEAHTLCAQALAELGRLDEATNALAQAIALAPEEGEYHFLLGQWQLRLGQKEAALASLRQATQLAPHQVQARLALGRLLGELKSWEETAAILAPAAATLQDDSGAPDGQRAEVAYLLGSALLRMGSPDEALPHLSQAVELVPTSVSYQSELGQAYLALGQPQEATHPLEEALREQSPSSEWEATALRLAEAYRRSHKLDAAEWLILKVTQQNPPSAPGHAELGRLRREQQRLTEAAAAWGQAVRLSAHDDAQAKEQQGYLLELAEVLNLVGQDGAAQDALAQVHPQDATTWEQVGRLYERLGGLKEALAAWLQAAAVEPAPERLVQVARLARRTGDAPAARDALRTALAHDGGQAAWHNELGELLEEQGDREGALASFQRAVELAPREATFRRNLGLLLEALGRLDLAKAELERVLHLNSNDEVAFRHLGAISAKLTLGRWHRSQGQPAAPPSPAGPTHRITPTRRQPGPPIRKP